MAPFHGLAESIPVLEFSFLDVEHRGIPDGAGAKCPDIRPPQRARRVHRRRADQRWQIEPQAMELR